ncbi:MAG: hypothetical protein DPW20_01060 [Candidatus Brocadia sp.]|uniref:Metal-dependent hydrolases of the beta-lactamase superfamily III n=2 Tax=Candidatus Brocadiaceae TaxID=1127830 RepID=A0ABQ0JVY7_9BACT|nr:MAG: hypothetical protein EDM70_02050 [Candidatus Brocadia sp. AMX2]MCQ3915972.1 hypothetical protein [Candidatus Brocadia sp.]GAN32915.1 metal-dependent hydrolases of the beta-lactamase superfamily III [Candidatus Brocadia sinica JPN1]
MMQYMQKNLRNCCFITALLLSCIVTLSTTNTSLATDESTDEIQTHKTVKYSTFFDKKTHWCDALVITCTDFRFTTATQEFINNRLGLKGNYDYISIPGSIRNLLDSRTRNLVLNTFGVSVRLHHVKRVVILGHQDCSIGYGGSKNFSEPLVEYKTICKDLKKARRLMRLRFPHLKVYLYYATVLSKDHQRIYNFKQIL